MNSSTSPAFLIGVTGHMDLRPDEVDRLKAQVRLLFRFLKHGAAAPDRENESKTLRASLVQQLPS